MPESEPTFEVGFVLAGAISAGAYSAGVIDFLVEALDAYETARTTGRTAEGETWDGPTHSVRVPVMAGASAGGMTAAMAAVQLHRDFDHAGPGHVPAAAASNRLYASWVDEIDIEPLLETADLKHGARLRSVLCCKVLDEIVERTLNLRPDRVRPWVGRGESNGLAVFFTVSDIGGVPYRFKVTGGTADADYSMLNHGDDLRFLVGKGPKWLLEHGRAGLEMFDLEEAGPDLRGRFGAAALATGAFPIGLAARPITRKYDDYDRDDRVGFERVRPDGTIEFVPVRPVPSGKTGDHRFVAVDGGVIDNEPFELARRYLAGKNEQNPANRNGRETRYAVVLVDPFPNRLGWPGEDSSDLLSAVTPALFSMLVDQARFKPQELSLALDESVFSRFAILPEPDAPSPASMDLPIACGALGGFSGFLHRSFRHHDYCLGRRNAQAFLLNHFCLPETNPLFAPWKSAGGNTTKWYVHGSEASTSGLKPVKLAAEAVPSAGEPSPPRVPALPIIPLTPRLRTEVVLGPADRPRPRDFKLDVFKGQLGARLNAVVERLIDDEIAEYVPLGWLGRQALKQFLPGVLRRKAMAAVEQALNSLGRAFPT